MTKEQTFFSFLIFPPLLGSIGGNNETNQVLNVTVKNLQPYLASP